MPEQQLTPEQQAAAKNAEDYVRWQLNPPAGQKHLSLLSDSKAKFLTELEQRLLQDEKFKDNEPERKKKLDAAAKAFDAEMVKRARAGVVAGGNRENYTKVDAEKKNGFFGMASGILDEIVGFIGSGVEKIWGFMKKIPFIGKLIGQVGEFFSDLMDGRTPEQKERESRAAGIADALAEPIIIEGQEIIIDDRKRARLYGDMKGRNFKESQVPAPSQPIVVPPGTIAPGAGISPPAPVPPAPPGAAVPPPPAISGGQPRTNPTPGGPPRGP